MQTDEHPCCREGCLGNHIITRWCESQPASNARTPRQHHTHSQSTKEGRECSVFLAIDREQYHAVRSGDHDRPQRRTKAKPSNHLLRWGQEEIEEKIPREHNLHETERHTSVTGNTCNEIQPPQNMKRSPWTLRRRSGPPTHNTLVFQIRVGSLPSSFASDERGSSASQSSGSGKTLRQKFYHHRQSAPCAASA